MSTNGMGALSLAHTSNSDSGGLALPPLTASARVATLPGVSPPALFRFLDLAESLTLRLRTLHGDKCPPVLLANVMDRADAWVAQGGRGLRLALERPYVTRAFFGRSNSHCQDHSTGYSPSAYRAP
jgi:hypothetical protein